MEELEAMGLGLWGCGGCADCGAVGAVGLENGEENGGIEMDKVNWTLGKGVGEMGATGLGL